jgi:DNA-binding beta-propeller fold protein YncE
VVRDAAGNLYVADFDNGLIRKVSPAGIVSTLVSQSNFNRPFGLALSGSTLYIQTDDDDTGAHGSKTGTVWSVSTSGGTAQVIVRDVGRPRGLAALADGRIVLSDVNRSTVSLLNPVTKAITLLAGTQDVAGFANGVGAAAKFDRPYGVAVGVDGNLYVVDQNNNCVRRVTLAGEVSMFAGTGIQGFVDGPRTSAQFFHPQGIAIDASGRMYITDNGNEAIRIIQTNSSVFTLAGGNGPGFADGANAKFFGEEGLTVTPDGSKLFVADGTSGNGGEPYNRIRTITP